MKFRQLQLNEPAGKLLLRFATGGLLIFHGVHKLLYGHSFIGLLLKEHGWPEFFRYGVPVGEVIAPIMLLLGIYTRIASLLVAFTMLMSIYLFYGSNAFKLDQFGGLNSQLNLFFLFSSISIFFLGAGRYSLFKGNGKWN